MASGEEKLAQSQLLLMCSVETSNRIGVTSALQDGARPDILDKNSERSPLHIAAKLGHSGIMSLLLLRCHTPDLPDKFGKTPLFAAVESGETECLKLLLEAGANPILKSTSGEIPFFLACLFGHTKIVNILKDKIAVSSLRDRNRSNALHYAVQGAAGPDLINILLGEGLDPLECNSHKKSSLQLARHDPTSEVCRLLELNAQLQRQRQFQQGQSLWGDDGGAAAGGDDDSPTSPLNLPHRQQWPYDALDGTGAGPSFASPEQSEIDRLRKMVEGLKKQVERQASDEPLPSLPSSKRLEDEDHPVLSEAFMLSLAKEIGGEAYQLPVHLGFSADCWDQLERKYDRDIPRAMFTLFLRWLKQEPAKDKATKIQELADALGKADRADLKNKVLKGEC